MTSLQDKVEFYSNLLDNCSDLIHQVTPEGKFIYVNKAWKETLGYSDEEIKVLSLMEIVEGSCKETCQAIFNDLLVGKHIDRNKTVFLTRDGHRVMVEGRCNTTFEDGKPIAMTGIFRNITAQLESSQALQEGEERFRTLFANSTDIMQIVAPDGHFLHVNTAWLNAFGYAENEVPGLTIFDLISPTCQDLCHNTFQMVLSTPGVHEINTTFIAKNGSKVEIEGNATATFKGDQAVYTQCIFKDVTEKRQMEEELLKAQKLESMGVFAGGIAHDFNNLLTAILGNISLVRATVDKESPLNAHLYKIEQASTRAKGLTQQLLTFAKGGAPIKKVSGIIDLVKDSVEFPLHGSKIKREYTFAPNLWTAEIDPDQISQVIQNLVLNAVQAMPDGGSLKVCCNNALLKENNPAGLPEGKYLVVSFTDEGHGIAKQDQGKIFDPYFSRKENGSGLGLAIAYSIIKKHGGLITVDSESGVGTTFTILLPAADSQVEPSVEGKQTSPRTPGRILIMDDEEIVQDIAGKMLKLLGYTFEIAKDGEQAVEMYRNALAMGNPFQAVLMDLTIPGGMGGKEAIIRLLEIDPSAKGIVSSGYANDPIMASYAEYGFIGVVPKPYQLDDLITALSQIETAE